MTNGRIDRRTWAEVDLESIRHNYRLLRQRIAKDAFFCPMIKANAYGHGDVKVARALRDVGCTHVGVSLIEEGLRVRISGDKGGILTFGVFDDVESARALVQGRLTPVVSTWEQILALEKVQLTEAFKIHFKFNTGMNRLGFEVREAAKLRRWLDEHPAFRLEGLASHLMRGDDAGSDVGESDSQFAGFEQVLSHFKDLGAAPHILNSSGEVNLTTRRDLGKPTNTPWPIGARPGIALYGIEPDNEEGAKLGLRPALKFVSHLIGVRRVATGERVSYGGTWRAPRESVIGVVPAGYADGVSRSLSNRGEVLVRGQRVKIAGIVCMDFFMVDLTDVHDTPQSRPLTMGDEVVLIGEQGQERIGAAEVAQQAQTIPYEVLTRLGERVPRLYRNE